MWNINKNSSLSLSRCNALWLILVRDITTPPFPPDTWQMSGAPCQMKILSFWLRKNKTFGTLYQQEHFPLSAKVQCIMDNISQGCDFIKHFNHYGARSWYWKVTCFSHIHPLGFCTCKHVDNWWVWKLTWASDTQTAIYMWLFGWGYQYKTMKYSM